METGWLPDTPSDDTVLRSFLLNQADFNDVVATVAGGRVERDGEVVCCDSGSVVPFLNQTVALRPLDDALVERIDVFHRAGAHGATLLSPWPTPDLSSRGWLLMGHPAFVVRAPGPVAASPAPGVEVRSVAGEADLGVFEQVLAEGYPMPMAQGAPAGSVIPRASLDRGVKLRLGLLDDVPVAAGTSFAERGVVNLCAAATLPAARRRGVWEALVWARVADAPELPAVAYTSDYSRPGFQRMGFLPITRFTLWLLAR